MVRSNIYNGDFGRVGTQAGFDYERHRRYRKKIGIPSDRNWRLGLVVLVGQAEGMAQKL
jgi:hypothetical protein